MDDFNNNKEITAFVVTTTTGCIGLNLAVANHAVLVDPWWNPAVEE